MTEWTRIDTAEERAARPRAAAVSPPRPRRRRPSRAGAAARWALVCALLPLLAVAPLVAPAVAQQSGPPTNVTPLFGPDTVLEPATVIDTPQALITRVSDRVRDRHAREGNFHAYDHYLPLYWEYRTVAIEIIDRVAKGGKSITYNMTSLTPLNQPNLRTFFEGKYTVAQYADNRISTQVDPLHYTVTLTYNPLQNRPIQIGDRIEMEFSPFLLPPVTGRLNYYGTAFLYVVGRGGMQPWEGRGDRLDSFPMPDDALLGGSTTLHRQYSAEPTELFKQLATNSAPVSGQPFVLGRRLHHTDFGTGAHSEPGNPGYPEIAGKLGRYFTERSCVGCHVNNARALPPAIGAPLTRYVVRVGSDAAGTPHPQLGSTLQLQAATGAPEGSVSLAGWSLTNGTYADGTPFTLRKPSYKFTGTVPSFYSIRIAPPLVGLGLLEALDEGVVSAQTAVNHGRMRLVSDPETAQTRLGRFGWKAGQARVRHQVASALINDMGVATTIFPNPDRGSAQSDRGPVSTLPSGLLELMARYVATLGVPPRRGLDDPQAVRGQALFLQAHCDSCHRPVLSTSVYEPLAELRNQVIRPYTDLLLHDMGTGLSDNMADGTAAAFEWRTAPLWGIGLTAGAAGGEAYLHDGRAASLSEAILWHAGEAQASRESFRTMPAADRLALLRFLGSL